MAPRSASPYQIAAFSMSAVGTPEIASAHPGVKPPTCSKKAPLSLVRREMNSSSTSPSRAMTWAIAASRATSEPTRSGR